LRAVAVEADPESEIQAGAVVLDPENHWVVREATLECRTKEGDYRAEERFQGRSVRPGFLVPVSYTHKVTGGKADYEMTNTFDLSVPTSPPEDAGFTLSAYGLPEPPGLARSPSRWYLWVLGVVAACFAVGYGLRRLGRRPSSGAK
jgi:hypothetical protein